jgi:hypothetical protein
MRQTIGPRLDRSVVTGIERMSHQEETTMDGNELARAEYWAPLLETIADIAFGIVIVALAVELVAGRIAKRFERQIDAARELQIAELNNETARLRKEMGPRHIDPDKFVAALTDKPKAPVEIMFPKENGEAFMLAIEFRDAIRKAGWQASEPIPVPPTDIPRLANQPSTAGVGGEPVGVSVAVRADTQADFEQFGPGINTPANAIFNAISAAFGTGAGYVAGPEVFNAPARGTVRIVVGPKP